MTVAQISWLGKSCKTICRIRLSFFFSQPQHFLHHPNVSTGGNAWPAAWKKKSLLVGQSSLPRRIPLHRPRPEHQLPHDWKGSWRRWAWPCYWNCRGQLMLFSMFFHISHNAGVHHRDLHTRVEDNVQLRPERVLHDRDGDRLHSRKA